MRLVAIALALTTAGCVAKQTVTGRETTPTPNAFDRMLNPENGLLLRKWVVSDDAERIWAALQRYSDGEVLDAESDDTLRRNGLRFVRVRADRTGSVAAGWARRRQQPVGSGRSRRVACAARATGRGEIHRAG